MPVPKKRKKSHKSSLLTSDKNGKWTENNQSHTTKDEHKRIAGLPRDKIRNGKTQVVTRKGH